MKKYIVIALVMLSFLLLVAPSVEARYIYHEVNIVVEGEYKIKSISSGGIFNFEGVGQAYIESKYVDMSDVKVPNWWNLF